MVPEAIPAAQVGHLGIISNNFSLLLSISNQSQLPANSFSKFTSFHSCSHQLIPGPCLENSFLMLALASSVHSLSLCLSNASEGIIHPLYSQTPTKSHLLSISASQTDCNLLPLPDLERVGEKHPECKTLCTLFS